MTEWQSLILTVAILLTTGYLFNKWLNKGERERQKKNYEEFVELMAEFDEMGYKPTTLTETPLYEAAKFKSKLIGVYLRK